MTKIRLDEMFCIREDGATAFDDVEDTIVDPPRDDASSLSASDKSKRRDLIKNRHATTKGKSTPAWADSEEDDWTEDPDVWEYDQKGVSNIFAHVVHDLEGKLNFPWQKFLDKLFGYKDAWKKYVLEFVNAGERSNNLLAMEIETLKKNYKDGGRIR